MIQWSNPPPVDAARSFSEQLVIGDDLFVRHQEGCQDAGRREQLNCSKMEMAKAGAYRRGQS